MFGRAVISIENMMMWMFVFMCAVCETVNGRRTYLTHLPKSFCEGKKNCGEEKCNIKIRVAVLKLA